LSRVRQLDSALPVVLMTAWASIDLAVEAMQGGGRDFVQKPWDNEKLLGSLRRQIEEGRVLRAKQREMLEAREIQQRLLPSESPKLSGCDIHFFWKPANDVGGDYFDAIRLTDSSAAVCMADVAGKGLPAALLMSNMQASVRGLAQTTSSPAEMCSRLNRVAMDNTRSGRFTTLFYGILDSARCLVRYSNAGHVPPILIRQDGAIARLFQGGTVLGVFPDSKYEEVEIPFSSGDRLVLITDGITEARNAQNEEFGEDRLIHLLRSRRGLPAADLQQMLLDSVASFAGHTLQDDAAIMIVSMR
jgi:sigma-B regulation protein RsbU (phosphoserine phosphatase)